MVIQNPVSTDRRIRTLNVRLDMVGTVIARNGITTTTNNPFPVSAGYRFNPAGGIPAGCREGQIMQYLSIADYAKLKNVSEYIIRSEVRKGNIKAERIGHVYRIPVGDHNEPS